ncbi:Spo22p SCDLUD_000299 [Saccharomycodes ludwigii]|uniref:Spo22p n=1 Tax=Saccharomycodes ludwigii TaxID=36035 RepID=UPI001E867F5F|nr:hypothetical protein SCDLUD_000299 [Saccharomycodes ludwigii]KAH3902714.1 hypothetical protein SCDLUD_000299 [Saccharomycodes ludwigii]
MNESNCNFQESVSEIIDYTNWLTNEITTTSKLEQKNLTSIEDKLDLLIPMVEKYDQSIRITMLSIDDDKMYLLENNVSNLWNSISIGLKVDHNASLQRLLCKCKFFATLLFSLIEALSSSTEHKIRILKCYVSCIKTFLDGNFTEVLTKVQEKSELLLPLVEEVCKTPEGKNKDSVKKLKIEYFLVNFQFNLANDKFEAAAFYQSKLNTFKDCCLVDEQSIIEICRTIYNTSLELTDKEHINMEDANRAISLLNTAVQFIDSKMGTLTAVESYNEVNYLVLCLLSKCLLETKQFVAAKEVIDKLQSLFPDKINTFKLVLQWIDFQNSTEEPPKLTTIELREKTIMKMIMSVNIKENLDELITCINSQGKYALDSALRCLDNLFLNRMDPEKDYKLLEKLILVKVFLISQNKTLENISKIKKLDEFFDVCNKMFTSKLSSSTTQTVVPLLWSVGKQLYKKKKYLDSIGWFELGLHEVLSIICDTRAKFQRALQLSHFELGNYGKISEIYEAMSEKDKNHSLSKLILFKTLVRQKKIERAIEVLNTINSKNCLNYGEILLYCIEEVKKTTELIVPLINNLLTFINLESVSFENLKPDSIVSIASVLRYSIQMLLTLNDEENVEEWLMDYAGLLKDLLTTSINFFTKIQTLKKISINTGHGSINVYELEWFAAICYNLQTKCFGVMDIKLCNHLMYVDIAIQFLQLIRTYELSAAFTEDINFWYSRCIILKCSYILDKKINLSPKLLNEMNNSLSESLEECRNMCLKDNKTQRFNKSTLDIILILFQCSLQEKDEKNIANILEFPEVSLNTELLKNIMEVLISNKKISDNILFSVCLRIISKGLCDSKMNETDLFAWFRYLLSTDTVVNEKTDACLKLLDTFHERLKSDENIDFVSSHSLKKDIDWLVIFCWNKCVEDAINGSETSSVLWCQKSILFAKLGGLEEAEKIFSLWSSLAEAAGIQKNSVLL